MFANRFIRILTVCLLCCFGCSGGGSDKGEQGEQGGGEQPENKEIVVSFRLNGELTEGGETALLSRSGGSAAVLYGIQVYAYSASAGSYQPYVSGVFDNPGDLSFTVTAGDRYKIRATAIVNGKELVKKSGDTYGLPLSAALTNSLAESSVEMGGLNASDMDCAADGKRWSLPVADRYYGELSDIIFDEDNNYVTISMKRVVFGVSYKIRNLREGSVLVSLSDGTAASPVAELTTDKQYIYTFSNLTQAWQGWQTGYSCNYTVKVEYKSPDNQIQLIGTKTIKAERRKVVSLTVNISAEPSFDLELESGDLEPGEDVIL